MAYQMVPIAMTFSDLEGAF